MRDVQNSQRKMSPPTWHLLMARLFWMALCGAVVTSPTAAHAQELQLSVNFLTVFPQGEFKDNIQNNGYGAGGNFLVRLKHSPILVGVDLGGVTYGSDSHRETLVADVPDVDVKVTTRNNIFMTHFVARAQPSHGTVRPYIDGLIGFKYLFTNTSIDLGLDEDNPSNTDLSDLTFSYGVGGGVQVQLNRHPKRVAVLLDAGVRYLRGSRSEYLREGSIRRENGDVFFDVLQSRTDIVTAQVGISLRF